VIERKSDRGVTAEWLVGLKFNPTTTISEGKRKLNGMLKGTLKACYREVSGLF
jgi:hypothetical protein